MLFQWLPIQVSHTNLKLLKIISALISLSGLPTTWTEPGSGPGSRVDLSVIRTMVNESQWRGNPDTTYKTFCYLTKSYLGSHTLQGWVTAVSQHISIPHAQVLAVFQQVPRNPAPNVPTVNNPSFFQNYFENHAPSSLSSSSHSQTLLPGYSTAHLHYQDERKRCVRGVGALDQVEFQGGYLR